MFKVGVFPGKFFPPHRGHLSAILKAGTLAEKLYVVVSSNEELEAALPFPNGIPPLTNEQRVRWLSAELMGFDHIKVISLKETGIKAYPNGWPEWCDLLNRTVPEKFDAIFGSDENYADEGYTTYFPDVKYVLCDPERSEIPISATMIRSDPYKYWDYILGPARPHFAKKILVCGTESCGKTTLTKLLAKHYNTSWTEEEGRYYSTRYMGGNESTFVMDDFFNICCEQRMVEEKAFRNANKLVFLDTDCLITQFYCEMYLGKQDPRIESFIDPNRYDYLFLMTPEVKWVADGFRFNEEQEIRITLHEKLKQMYIDHGFGDKIIEIGGSYAERLSKSIEVCDSILKRA